MNSQHPASAYLAPIQYPLINEGFCQKKKLFPSGLSLRLHLQGLHKQSKDTCKSILATVAKQKIAKRLLTTTKCPFSACIDSPMTYKNLQRHLVDVHQLGLEDLRFRMKDALAGQKTGAGNKGAAHS